MHNQIGRRNTAVLRVLTIAAAAFAFCATASAQSSEANPQAVPKLKGGYVLTDVQLCVPGKSQNFQITGLATFDPATGKMKLNGYTAGGDPMTLNHVRQTLSYSNSATTVTLGDTVYQVTYGSLENGIAAYLSLMAVADPCAAQIWMSRQ